MFSLLKSTIETLHSRAIYEVFGIDTVLRQSRFKKWQKKINVIESVLTVSWQEKSVSDQCLNVKKPPCNKMKSWKIQGADVFLMIRIVPKNFASLFQFPLQFFLVLILCFRQAVKSWNCPWNLKSFINHSPIVVLFFMRWISCLLANFISWNFSIIFINKTLKECQMSHENFKLYGPKEALKRKAKVFTIENDRSNGILRGFVLKISATHKHRVFWSFSSFSSCASRPRSSFDCLDACESSSFVRIPFLSWYHLPVH